MNVELGLWIIPLLLTGVIWYMAGQYEEPTGGGYFGDMDIEGAFRSLMAITGTLFVWLVWAVFD